MKVKLEMIRLIKHFCKLIIYERYEIEESVNKLFL